MPNIIYEDESWSIEKIGPFTYIVAEIYSGTILLNITITTGQFCGIYKTEDEIVTEIVKRLNKIL